MIIFVTMRKVGIWMLAVVFTSCVEHRPDEPQVNSGDTKEDKAFIAEKTYAGFRIFEGKIPCADCAAIQQRLVIKGDTLGIYRLTEIYKDASEDGDATIISTGEWKFQKNKKSNKRELYLSQGHIGDSVRVSTYAWFNNSIRLLDDDGEAIQSTSNYTLKLTKKSTK